MSGLGFGTIIPSACLFLTINRHTIILVKQKDQFRPTELPIFVQYNGHACQFLLTHLPISFQTFSDRLARALEQKDPVDNSTGSPETMDLACAWLERCKKSHFLCKSPESHLPTRVIDVENLETNTVPLSQKVVLPSIDQWPKTFRDAIYVTGCLGIRYIWIDALCIAQEDENDWAFESGRMEDYYLNSTITIAAARIYERDKEHSLEKRETFYAHRYPKS
ncbi:hypothetical protein BS50DRAFT_581825 [Corynespora cassiicola Philippines]|uniref:Heterokaryon incompatibility domain-containing protein n=1 Tax=Corynespora cassiicola Philippines TaxID=1448308 RepID=A0A2T2PBP8_CORCC|nr:hypothetical protein BS50DRAFT_581825 [Corynespora cassiicola Philippines]